MRRASREMPIHSPTPQALSLFYLTYYYRQGAKTKKIKFFENFFRSATEDSDAVLSIVEEEHREVVKNRKFRGLTRKGPKNRQSKTCPAILSRILPQKGTKCHKIEDPAFLRRIETAYEHGFLGLRHSIFRVRYSIFPFHPLMT